MNIFNRFIITTLLVLSTSQVLALNTIEMANTPLVPAQSRVEAFASFNGLAITAKKKLGVNGNGLKLSVEENNRDVNAGLNTDGCVKDSGRSFADKTSIVILCGTGFTGGISYTSELAIVINSLEYFSSSAGSSTRRPDLGNGGTDIVLSGGKDAAPAQAQVTTFTPTSANSTKTYIITINNTLYTTQANASTPIKAIVEALQAKVTANTAITCTEDDSKITCTANTADTAFTYASSVDDSLVITTSNLTIPEETQTVATLATNKDGTTFSLDGTADNNNLFKIENNVLKFKDSNGIDFDTAQPKVYTIHLKASKNGETDVTKTITITLTDTNDNPPTDITLSNSTLIIVEGVNYFDNDPNHLFLVANLGAIDVDTTNTFTFSLENNTGNFFKIVDGTKLRIIKTADYETNKTLSVDVKVTDGAGHEYTKTVTVTVTDVNDNTPKNLQLNPLTIIDGTPANTQIATTSATDADTNTQFYYGLVDDNTTDNNKFSITTDGKLSITETVNLATKNSYKVYIRVADGNASDPLKRDLLKKFTLTVIPRLTITSSNRLNINEGENTTHTLTANENATFSIIENTSNLFSLSGTNNATLAFSGTTTDFESATKSYSVKVKATTGNEDYKNTEQTIAINLVDINDNTPTDILLTGNIDNNVGTIEDDKRKLLDGSSSGTVATLTTTDADTNNTFTYTLTNNQNNTLKISNDGTKLELQATVDYEVNTNKTLSFSIKVNDGNGHEFTQDFTLEIKDVDDTAPTNILINTTNIADNISASMQVAYFSAVDSDTVGTHRYSFDNLNGVNNADNGKFTLSTDGKLSVKAAVNFATQSQYHIVIQVADTGATFSRGFTLNVVQTLTITSPATATVAENSSKVITLTANRDNVAFAITNGADKAKFTLSGTTLTFAATDFEARVDDNTYEVEITASKTGEISSTQTLIVTLTDLNDETPTAITFSGNLSIAESTVIDAELGTFATTDADTSDTFTYTSSNTAFTFDNNKLKLNTTLNYETTTSLATTITVTDGNSHTFNKDFTFTITDTNNIAPSNIQLTTTTIADNTTAGTTIATISATDTDTTGETITYTLGGTDATSFTISGNQLKTAYAVVFANKSSYNISIIASDGVNASAPMNFTLAVYENLAITSLATATAIENTAKAITLIANKSGTTFAITDGTDKAKFTLSGTTLTFAATDFEARTNDNTYEVVITARKTGETDATQTLIITLTDINDESPTAITFTGNLSIAENTIIGAELGTFSTTDADTSDTFTYTSSNTAFTFDNNKLKLNAALDYESPISLVTTITVTDANSHTFNKDFTFIIADTNDITPSSIQLSATTIADSTLANTTVATLAATDEDTTGETITYTLGGADATSFTISGNQLKIVNTVVHTTKSSYNITITASDGTNTSAPMNFSFSVNANFAITSSAAATVIENTSKTITLTANRNDATFTITGGADKAKFTLSSTTLTFAATDFEARANSAYEVVITASKRGETDATQTLIVTLTDINDETPTAITFTGNLSIAENTTTTELGTFSTTDADTGDTFTYTSSNTAFILDNNKLKLNTTLDYENTTNLTTTITVTDGNSHTFNKDFTFTITDANDIAPSSIQLTTTTIADTTTAGTTIATISATDADTTGETITYTLGGADATSFTINGNQLKIANTVVHATKSSYNITITASDGTNTSAPMNFSFSVNADFAITSSTTVTAIEKADKVITLAANKSGATFAITGGINRAKFTLNDATLTFTATDFEDGAENTYKVEITAYKTGETDVTQTLTLTLEKIVEIAIANQSRSVNENSAIDTNIGTPLIITGTIATFEITAGNDDDLFKINNTGQIQVAKNALDHENKSSHILTVKITGTNAIDKTAQITIVITDIDDTAPTNIVLSKSTITSNDAPVGTIIGTLFATDIDTTSNLTYSVSANDNFKISGNKLKLKKAVADITFPITITITASDGTRTSAQQNFEITKATINLNIVPAINQFIVIQGEKEGRIISKDGGEVKIHTLVDTQTYEWSGTDINGTDINDGASNSTTLTFDPSKITLGTVTVKLKVTTGEHTSERTLLLKLIEKSEDVNSDSDGDGIPDEKDINHAGNQIQADEDEGENKGKAIISKENTRILLGDLALGKNSTLLTLDQIKEYVTTNNLLDKTKDTLTTGAIYDYVVEGLSATGISSEVIIELTTAIPKDAELRKYSLVNGWSNFVVNNNNKIYSKTGATCTDDDQKTWKVGLIEGATCLKLTIKDGGENDTDGQQTDNTGDVNSVIVSTIAIATPVANSGDDSDDGDGGSSSSSSSSGGGCVYNPNAPARFDMGFILLMVLGAYYLLRRKRRLIR